MTKTFKTYAEYRKEKQNAVNALPLFFAFTEKQLNDELEKRGATVKDIYRLGSTGGFYLKTDAEKVKAFFCTPDELPELMKNFDFAVDAFLYEMNNHEYAINWQGDYDVCQVFSQKELDYSEEKGAREYLIEAGMEYALKAFANARSKHYKMARELEWF